MFNFSSQLQELRSTLIGLALLLGATIIGLVWISIGLNHWLSEHLGPLWGPAVLGSVYFLPITIFAFVKAFRHKPTVSSSKDAVDITIENLTAALENLSGLSPLATGIAVAITSFLATRSPSLLIVFMQLLTAYTDDIKNRAAKAAAKSDGDSTHV